MRRMKTQDNVCVNEAFVFSNKQQTNKTLSEIITFNIFLQFTNVGGGIGDKCQLWAANVKKTMSQ